MKEELLNLNFEITHNCNQECKYCYNGSILNKPNGIENPIKVINKLFKIASIKHFTFTGGEPLLSKDILECAVQVRLNNSATTIITNASTDNKPLLKSLINIGACRFQITVNSHKSIIHDSLSQVAGSWNSTIRNVEYILNAGGIVIPTIVLTSENSDNIEELLKFIQSMGMNTVIINRYNLSQGVHFGNLTMSKKLLNEVFVRINSYANENELKVTSNVCTPYCFLDPRSYKNISFGQCSSNPLEKPITIDYGGNVRLCNHSPHVIGNIFNNKFSEMLFSQYTLSWVSQIPEFCIECNRYEDCKGGCRAASEQIKGSHLIVDPILDRI